MFHIERLRYKNILRVDALHLPQGRICCITGRSGSGKSTLLKLLNKLISPDAGSITYRGKPLSQWSSVALRREVSMLAQQPIIYQGSVRHNLKLGFWFQERTEPSDRVMREMLNRIGLAASLDANAQLLSGGEAQRLSVARVLLLEPAVLLLDEPSSALDRQTERELITAVSDHVLARGATVVMVTHAQDLVERHAHQIVRLDAGHATTVRSPLAKEASHGRKHL